MEIRASGCTERVWNPFRWLVSRWFRTRFKWPYRKVLMVLFNSFPRLPGEGSLDFISAACRPPPPPPPPRTPQTRAPDHSGHCRISTASCQTSNRERNGHCRTSTASSRALRGLPDLNGELQSSVGAAGPQPAAPDLSGQCQTSTPSSRSQ